MRPSSTTCSTRSPTSSLSDFQSHSSKPFGEIWRAFLCGSNNHTSQSAIPAFEKKEFLSCRQKARRSEASPVSRTPRTSHSDTVASRATIRRGSGTPSILVSDIRRCFRRWFSVRSCRASIRRRGCSTRPIFAWNPAPCSATPEEIENGKDSHNNGRRGYHPRFDPV